MSKYIVLNYCDHCNEYRHCAARATEIPLEIPSGCPLPDYPPTTSVRFEHIKQSLWNSCYPATLAMIIGETEKYVLDWFKFYGPPLCDEDGVLFLAHHGIYLATLADLTRTNPEGRGVKLSADTPINMELTLHGHPALIIVESWSLPGRTHAIFWDGRRVYDPKMDGPTENLEDYVVLYIYPILWTNRRHRQFLGEEK